VSNTVVCVEGTVVFSNVALPVVNVKNASGALVDTARIITIQRGARQAHVQACSTASLAARASGTSAPASSWSVSLADVAPSCEKLGCSVSRMSAP